MSINLGGSLLFKRAQAQGEGGLLSGVDPTQFNQSDPLRLWIIQMGLIIATAQLLSLGLAKMRQPKVIAEVLGGILLGPTAFGRIPGFTEHIFPPESIYYLSLTANIGLVLFLFLVGLEIESSVVKRNARLSAAIALGGMILPFGLGAAFAIPLYKQFISTDVVFTHFMLFTGVAYSITAFPVLARILTELKLVDTRVGVIVLSAGVGNDVVGWILLALSVALVNAGSGLDALYILLTTVAFAIFLLFPVRWALLWLARRTGSIERGPTMFFMTITILTTFASAFFTDAIGVNAIFGGFLTGLIVPREGGLAITLTEKLEDMVTIIFLPLYFTLSGLSTNLGLLNTGTIWAFTVGICSLAYCGKFGGCTIAARLTGFGWREACTIGTLMSCKGLVELIVLNVGLSAGILTQRVFSMFVLEALLLTFMTTPVVTILYPPERRSRSTALGDFQGVSGVEKEKDEIHASGHLTSENVEGYWKSRITVILDKFEHLPSVMTASQLFQQYSTSTDAEEELRTSLERVTSGSGDPEPRESVQVNALRLIELSDRTSDVMRSTAAETMMQTDPILGVFRTFGELNNLPIIPSLSVVTFDDLAPKVAEHAKDYGSDLVLIPWLPPYVPHHPSMSSEPVASPGSSHNPFDSLFKTNQLHLDGSASSVHSHFVRNVFAHSTVDVALFVDQGRSSNSNNPHVKTHIFLPFFGGPDDRLALSLAVQLCANPRTSATVARITKTDFQSTGHIERPTSVYMASEKESLHENDHIAAAANIRNNGFTVTSVSGIPDTVYGHATTQTRLQSETADNIMWSRYASPTAHSAHSPKIANALTRVEFIESTSPTPLHEILRHTRNQVDESSRRRQRLTLIVGRSRRMAVENHHQELKDLMDEHGGVSGEVRKTLGDVASAIAIGDYGASFLVVQASRSDEA